MTRSGRLRDLLMGGDRRSIGRVDEVLELVLGQPKRVSELAKLLWDSDAVVRMRAADALEKISRERPEWIDPFKPNLLGLMAETGQQELRWHLAAIVPRVQLTPAESSRAVVILKGYLTDRSSIVKTFAMQGLWELTQLNAESRSEVVELVRELVKTGTAAMRARGRKLLREVDRSEAG